MRYRLMASYLGAPYQAAVGPSDRDVSLFAAPPPPEEHGFSPAPGGIWRKQVRLDDLDALWESRPIGSYHGDPCLVLDDLGDRLHIVYLGMDSRRAAQLGYWEVDQGVFEVVVPRYDVTDLAEERHEFPISLLLSALPPAPRALGSGAPAPADSGGGPGALGFAPNGAGMAPQRGDRAVGAGAGPVPVPGGMGAGPGGQGVTGGPMWNGPAGIQQPPAGQLPAAGPGPRQAAQPPAAMSQPPAPASVQQPVTGTYYSMAGPAQNGPGLLQQPGQQPPSGPNGVGPLGAPAGQFGVTAPGQGAPGSPTASSAPPANGLVPSAPMQLPGRQLPPAQQPVQQQPAPPQPVQQFQPLAPAAPQAMGIPQPGTGQQGTGPQPAMPQPAMPQPATAQAPTAAMAAWHGSPAADGNGNGTWYFQPAQAPAPNGFGGMQQYAQPGTAQPQVAQPQVAQPQVAQPGQAGQGPAFAAPQAPPPAAVPLAAPMGTAEPAMPGGPAAGNTGLPMAGLPAPQAPAGPPMGAATAGPGPVAAPQTGPTGPVTAPMTVAAPAAAPPPVLQQPVAPQVAAQQVAAQQQAAVQQQAAPQPMTAPSETSATGPLAPLPPSFRADQGTTSSLAPAGALSKLTGAVRGRRAARKPRLAMSAIFADLVDMADIPRSAYAVDDEITGAMCLFKTDGGYEVFSCAEDARHEVRFFEEEEAAYFYLFGVLAAEALRNGRLSPRRG